MQRRPIELWRVQRAVLSLLLSSGVCLVPFLRPFALKPRAFDFNAWNIPLAWIPLFCAFIIYALHTKGPRYRPLIVICSILWFLFYPNAPYLVTDLIHIRWQPGNPPWFDLLLMMTVVWTGLLIGNLSLYLMQEAVRAWRGWAAGWLFTLGMLALGSVGVFVGRFWRWNSGDVLFLRPHSLVETTNNNLHATTATDGLIFLATFFAFSSLTYATLYSFIHLRTDSPAAPREEIPSPGAAEKPVAVRPPF